jgi:Protein of unknown function (DUF4242)
MEQPMRAYLAECFWPGVSEAQLNELDSRAAEAAVAGSGSGAHVRYCGSILIPQDEVVFCFFEGPSATVVEATARRASVPFARIVESTGVPRHGRIGLGPKRATGGGAK